MTSPLASLRAVEPPVAPSAVRRREPVAAAPRPVAEPVLPNPQLRLDPALGLVVLEFRDRGGQARTIPTERELDAYRSNARGASTAVEGNARSAGDGAAPGAAASADGEDAASGR